jgi:hypothetical protein
MGAIAIAVVRRRAAVADLSKVVPAAIGEVWTFIERANFPALAGISRSTTTTRRAS